MLDQKQVRDINMQSPKKKETALLYACRGGQLKAVKYLVEHGANVNLKGMFILNFTLNIFLFRTTMSRSLRV